MSLARLREMRPVEEGVASGVDHRECPRHVGERLLRARVRVRVRVRVRAMARVRARGRAMGRVRVTVRVKGRARVRVRFTGGASAFCTPRQYSPMTTRARNMCCTPCALGRE